MPALLLAKSILEFIGLKDGKLVIGKSEIVLPRGFFFDATQDTELIEEIVRHCFIRPRAMWEDSYRENIDYVVASLEQQMLELDKVRTEKFLRSSGTRASVYRDMLGSWADSADYLLKSFRDMRETNNHDFGSDRTFSHEDFMRELALYRLKALGYVEALLVLLPENTELQQRTRELIKKVKDQAVHDFSLSLDEIVMPMFVPL